MLLEVGLLEVLLCFEDEELPDDEPELDPEPDELRVADPPAASAAFVLATLTAGGGTGVGSTVPSHEAGYFALSCNVFAVSADMKGKTVKRR